MWAAYINDKGGIGGHPVRLVVYDDRGDPATNRSQTQQAVERDHAIAFVYNAAPFYGSATRQYLEAKRVPVIGTDTGTQAVYESPMYFPQATSGNAAYHAALLSAAQQAVPVGKTKLGTITCVEAQQCADAERFWGQQAPAAGFQHVYRGRASITVPDYTAECLSARNAGAQVLLLAMDEHSTGRLVRSCLRQDFRPLYANMIGVATDQQKDNPDLDGLVSTSVVFPYFQSGTAATDEFQQVMRTYGENVDIGINPANAWVAAKLFEKAAADLSAQPTSADILRGLWAMRDETLGGLTSPRSFTENETAPQTVCWYSLKIENREWTAFDGFRMHCR